MSRLNIGAALATFLLPMSFLPAAAQSDAHIAQSTLSALGYSIGAVDGVWGAKSAGALSAYFAANGHQHDGKLDGEALQLLEEVTYGQPLTPEMFDVTSEPHSLSTQAQRDRVWNEYRTNSACFTGGPDIPRVPHELKLFSGEDFAALAPRSAFPPPQKGLASCQLVANQEAPLQAFDPKAKPAPIVSAGTLERYGLGLDDLRQAAAWFQTGIVAHRHSPDPVIASALIDALVDWADANALSENIIEHEGSDDLKFDVTLTIGATLIAAVELAELMTAQQQAAILPWINRNVARLAAVKIQARPSNHDNLFNYFTAIWGIAVNDRAAVQRAIDGYKRAIHEMRPDGSWPYDSQRGANGNHYNNAATSDLLSLGMLIQQRFGLPLLDYEVDGRSAHRAVEYVAQAAKDPVASNLKYALPCSGGDFLDENGVMRDRANPDISWTTNSGWMGRQYHDTAYLGAYASLYPERPVSPWIARTYGGYFQQAAMTIHTSTAPVCMYNLALPAGVAERYAPERLAFDFSGYDVAEGISGQDCYFTLARKRSEDPSENKTLATATALIENGYIRLQEKGGRWSSGLNGTAQDFTAANLAILEDGSIVGALQVHFLSSSAEEAPHPGLNVRIEPSDGVLGSGSAEGAVEFKLDGYFTGEISMSQCRPIPG
jgi:hypothetical protein